MAWKIKEMENELSLTDEEFENRLLDWLKKEIKNE